MAHARFTLGLDRLSIRSRIIGGFAVVLMLLGVLAAISIRGIGIVETEAGHVQESSRVATVIGGVAVAVPVCVGVSVYVGVGV